MLNQGYTVCFNGLDSCTQIMGVGFFITQVVFIVVVNVQVKLCSSNKCEHKSVYVLTSYSRPTHTHT